MLFSYTLPLCKILQSPLSDLSAAVQHFDLIIKTIADIRQNVDLRFTKIFKAAQDLLTPLKEDIEIPRLALRQQHRPNYSTTEPETYFRRSIMIPLLDEFLDQLLRRFKDHNTTLSSLNIFIPSVSCKNKLEFQMDHFSLYKQYLNWDCLQSEFDLWKQKWLNEPEINRPTSAIEVLGECNQDLFPNSHKLLQILATLPVTTCTPERSFSSLKRLKTYLRNCTGQERLNRLALMLIHRRISIDTEEVIDLFAAKKAGR